MRLWSLPPLQLCRTGVWSEQRATDGTRYYYNEATNTSKWELDEEEMKHLVPNLNPYDNDLAMPLRVSLECCFSTSVFIMPLRARTDSMPVMLVSLLLGANTRH